MTSVHPSLALVAAPALGSTLALLARRSGRTVFVLHLLAALGAIAVAAAMLVVQVHDPRPRTIETFGRLPFGDTLDVPLRLHADRYAVLLAVTVTVVAAVVQVYGRWYLYHDPRYRSFAAAVGLFTSAMLLLVLSGDVLLTIAGWELMGWCSFLLIGHESQRRAARAAAHKAFLVTRLADAPFVIGMLALAGAAHSTSLDVILRALPHLHHATLTGALLCIVVGVAGKSAQVPFQDWLPDAMEGPTPASALIHAATMVAAGTVVLARLLPLLQAAPAARWALAISAALSTVLGAALAFAQPDLKRMLAWSTVSQVGLMLLALAVAPAGGGPDVAFLQLVAHAAFKALLFLVVGWLAVLAGGVRVERMSGVVRRHPATARLTAIALLALAAVPPTVGFVAKDLIVEDALRAATGGDRVAIVAAVAAGLSVFLTAAYAMRAWLIVSRRTIREHHAQLQLRDDADAVQELPLVELLERAHDE